MCSKRASDGVGTGAARHWPLSVTLTLWYTLACFAIVCLAATLMYVGLVASLDRDHDQFLIGKVDAMRQLLRDRPGDVAELQEEADEAWASSQYARVCARVLDAGGRTLVESSRMGPDLSVEAFAKVAPASPTSPVGTTFYSRSGKPFRGLVVRCGGAGDPRSFTLQVALETYGPSHLLLAFRQRLYVLLGVLLVVSAGIGHVLARRGLRPIAEMSRTASRIGSTTLDRRLDVSACPAEVATLAGTFNGVLDRLEEAFDRLSRFSADIAHELRTPVNNLRVQAEVTLQRPRTIDEYRHALASTLEEGLRLSRIIDSLLFLARAGDPATQVTREALDPGAELGVLREFYEAAAADAGVELSVRCESSARLWADRVLLQRAVGNLIENSLAHTAAGGRVTVAAYDADGAVVIEVTDTGCGIAPEHVGRVTDRFYRVDPSRASGGTRVGLGLSIVKSIATLHGGSLDVRSEVGFGTSVSLTFPTGDLPRRAQFAEAPRLGQTEAVVTTPSAGVAPS
jgi:two-component system heavy metal sensor histidine kinase CusS